MEIAWLVDDTEMKKHGNREASAPHFHYPSIFAEQYRRINRAMNFQTI